MSNEELEKLAIENGISVKIVTEEMIEQDRENVEKDHYEVEDCCLVRATDIFPEDKRITTPKNSGAYMYDSSDVLGNAIRKAVRAKYSEKMTEEEEKGFYEELSEYEIFFPLERTTIHFTLNSLVSSHMFGNFDDRPFIILEPLREHITSDFLTGMRVEDTYFNDDMELSESAVVMMRKEIFLEYMSDDEKRERLKNMNVIVFEGEEDKAVRYVLHDLGYNAFEVASDGFGMVDLASEERKMLDFVTDFALKNGISRDRHFDSVSRYNDCRRQYYTCKEFSRNHYVYILENSPEVDYDLATDLLYTFDNTSIDSSNYEIGDNEEADKIVSIIGLDKIKELTKIHNEMVLAKHNMMKNNEKVV